MITATDTGALDHTGLRVLTFADCLDRVASQRIGRVAFMRNAEIVVLPVHHILDGTSICFRTAGPSKLEVAAEQDSVGFEVDQFDPTTRTGWSVTATGTASIVEDVEQVGRLDRVDPMPWHVGDAASSEWVQIRCSEISGRELIRPVDDSVPGSIPTVVSTPQSDPAAPPTPTATAPTPTAPTPSTAPTPTAPN